MAEAVVIRLPSILVALVILFPICTAWVYGIARLSYWLLNRHIIRRHPELRDRLEANDG